MLANKLSLIQDVEAVKELTGFNINKINKLLYLKRGPQDAQMVTHGLYQSVINTACYELHAMGLHPVAEKSASLLDLEHIASSTNIHAIPPFLEIDARWDMEPIFCGDKNNILGDNGCLFLPQSEIIIPSLVASNHYLSYYGALLLKPGDQVRFPDPTYPIWAMTIHKNYINEFLMSPAGGGFYLEYHHDQPHYHHALQGEGHYLLAKWDPLRKKLQMTGFRIPTGHAIYTKKGAIHCDAALVGDYLVGYTTSQQCSTVLLHQHVEKKVSVVFINQDR